MYPQFQIVVIKSPQKSVEIQLCTQTELPTVSPQMTSFGKNSNIHCIFLTEVNYNKKFSY